MEFKAFEKISNLKHLHMTISQKIHGTNAQIVITKIAPPEIINMTYDVRTMTLSYDPACAVEIEGSYYLIRAGSRNRWIFVGDDNYGFAAFVDKNKFRLIKALGEGTHFGEWAGPGINSGEGLSEKTFVLFDVGRYEGIELPPQTRLVPILYYGPVSMDWIDFTMQKLKTEGSALSPGFMRPEGVVATIGGKRYKSVFEAEETQWTKPGKKSTSPKEPSVDYSYLLQPIRLEKLLSRDERLMADYPSTIPQIVKLYVQDLEDEGQIVGDEAQKKAIRKGASSAIFEFVRKCAK